MEQGQAQLFIHIYPSQDNPTTQTVWIFSGSSTANNSGAVRTSASSDYNAQDTFQLSSSSGNIFNANKPSDTNFQLSPLFSSANTDDIASIRARIPGGGKTDITFAASATNTPTITIGSGSRTISHMFLDDDSVGDDMGIRTASTLSYSSGNSSAWAGAGLINKPIGDFFALNFNSGGGGLTTHPHFATGSAASVRIRVNSAIIPEPKEYALVFGLFALGFVLFLRYLQKKQHQQALVNRA